MAKQNDGYLGGFSGRLGTAIGYQWNGKWCMRSRPAQVRNPRTALQQSHRAAFRQQVQLAARMRWVINKSLTPLARQHGMTAYNLFMTLNQQSFSMQEGCLEVDWSTLQLSSGPVAPVAVSSSSVSDGTVLHVQFDRNPQHRASNALDSVHLYVYCPTQEDGYLAAPVYRKSGQVSVDLPSNFRGEEVHLFLLVQDGADRWSSTAYAGSLRMEEDELQEEEEGLSVSLTTDVNNQEVNTLQELMEVTDEASEEPADDAPPTMQLSLW